MAEISPRSVAKCKNCGNHDLEVILKGHKQFCPYQTCSCEKCRSTSEQRRKIRVKSAIRRAEAQERVGTTVHVRPQPQVQVTAASSSQPNAEQQQGNSIAGQAVEDRKILLESSSQLLEMFRFPWEMMPLMYALSKYANGNTQEVLMKIYEGQLVLNEEFLRAQNMNLGAAPSTSAQETPSSSTQEC